MPAAVDKDYVKKLWEYQLTDVSERAEWALRPVTTLQSDHYHSQVKTATAVHYRTEFLTGCRCSFVDSVQLECGPMPNTMAALPNKGGTLCKSSVIPFLVLRCCTTAQVPCSNAANIEERKTWTQSEFCSWQNCLRGQQAPKMYI